MILLIKMNSNTNNLNKVESTMIEEQLNKELLTYYYTTSDNTCLEYFVGYEVATLLGYKNTAHTIITNVSTSNQLQFRDYKGVKEPYLDPRTILISRDGAIEILLKTRKSISADVLQILQKNNIKIPTKKSILKETEKIQVNYTENNQELDFEDEEENEKNTELTTYSYISNHICFEYFVGYQIAVLLGYKNITQVIQNISKSNQLLFSDYPGPKIPYLDPRTILISRDGAIEILIKTRKRISADVLHLLKKFHIETTNMKCLTKEQQTLSAITNALKTEKYEDQYKIGSYYLDLYFTEYKIVVECDENGHADRKPYKERERMDYVNKELDIDDSNWIRYNPDEKDFDISKMIGRIYIKMKEIKFINDSKLSVVSVVKEEKTAEESVADKQEDKDKISGDIKSVELKAMCKKYGLFTSGNKPDMLDRLKLYFDTGENKRNVIEMIKSNETTCGSTEETESDKKEILENLNNYTYEKIMLLCKKYGINQTGRSNELCKKIKDYLECGYKDNLRRKDVYKYDSDGKFIKHWKTITEAVGDCLLNKNLIANALDQMYIMDGFIWRSQSVIFSKEDLDELSSNSKKTRKYLTPKDHEIIRKRINSSENKYSLMIEYSLSKTQMNRILRVSK